jgi:dipeptidyl aminopeptidase/acylaminoacyl peptidase
VSIPEDRLRAALERAAEQGDPSRALGEVSRRSARRALVRRAQLGALAVAVLAGTVGGTWGLSRLFREAPADTTGATEPEPLIAFSSYRDGRMLDVYVMRPDGTGVRRVTDGPAEVEDHQPAWSPNGSMIAFSSTRSHGPPHTDGDIFVMGSDGSEVRQVTFGFDSAGAPAWSPDGSWIAFAGERDGNWDIYAVGLNGGQPTRLTDDPGFDYDPSWSPEGSLIAFSSSRSGDGDIYVMGADGTNVVQVTGLGLRPEPSDIIGAADDRQFEGSPAWSPDGRQIAFAGEIGDNSEVFVMGTDGSDVVQLTDEPALDTVPAWSPDGTKIAFTSHRVNGEGDIFVVNADGTGLAQLTDNPAGDYDPAWRPAPGTAVSPAPVESAAPSPEPTGEPSATPMEPPVDERIPEWMRPAWEDPACEASVRIANFDGPEGEPDVAIVTHYSCLEPGFGDEWVLGIEWDDGDTSIQFLHDCERACRAITAPDLDADGNHELGIVVDAGASTDFIEFFELPAIEHDPTALTVSQPGAPGFPANETARFAQGGSVTHMDQLSCRHEEDRRVLIHASGQVVGDGQPEAWRVTETTFGLIGGRFVVLGTREYEEPYSAFEAPSFTSGEQLCGSNLGGDVIDG